jgi:hypothetical protein
MVRNRVRASYSHFYRNEGVLQLASNYKDSRVSYIKNTYSKSCRGFFLAEIKMVVIFGINKIGINSDNYGRWVLSREMGG